MSNLKNRVDRLLRQKPDSREPQIIEWTLVSGPPGGPHEERLGSIWIEGRGTFVPNDCETHAAFRARVFEGK